MSQVTQERNGWSQVPHWLLPLVKPAAVVVYAQLAAYAWMPDGARPAIKRVASELGMSESTVKRCIQELESVGAVAVESRDEEGVQLPNRYHLKLTRAGGGFTSEPTGGSTGEPRVGSPVTYEEEGVREEEVKKTGTTSIDSDFAAFWAACPKKVGKVNARREYTRALKRTDAATLLDKMREYALVPRQTEYVVHPERWLKHDRWEDESAPSTTVPHRAQGFIDMIGTTEPLALEGPTP